MEAHQNFGTLIDLSCCSAIKLGITNAERYPRPLELELVLVNTRLTGKPAVSLGRSRVTAPADWWRGGNRGPMEEVLTFDIPTHPAIQQFDEAKIVFHRTGPTAAESAKVAIERFVLVP
jgi:hypothetical protein